MNWSLLYKDFLSYGIIFYFGGEGVVYFLITITTSNSTGQQSNQQVCYSATDHMV